MKTINIKGKEYVPVVERIKEFHKYFRGNIETEILPSDNVGRVIVQAVITITGIISDKGDVLMLSDKFTFTGHSQAEWGKGLMGAVALEVAETSAIGRALGFANIGLLDGIASADEMRKVSKKDYQKKNKEDFVNGVDPLLAEDNEDVF